MPACISQTLYDFSSFISELAPAHPFFKHCFFKLLLQHCCDNLVSDCVAWQQGWLAHKRFLCLSFQVERNLHDAMNVARNVITDPRLVPGGGACEMALAHVRIFS